MTTDDATLTGVQFAVTSAALEGDTSALYHLTTELLGQGIPFESVLFDVIAPVQRSLGERWVSGDYLISEEHVATNAIDTVVSLLGGSFEQPEDAPRVVIACVEGEHHVLPGRMLAAHLLSEGFRTVHLGSSMPAGDLQSFLVADPPDVLILTCTMTMSLPGARKSIDAGHAAGVPVVIGGPAFGSNGERAARLGADAWVPRLRDVAPLLRTSTPTLAESATTAITPAPDLEPLVASRPTVVAAASAMLGGGPERSAQHLEPVELAFDALAAALASDETELLYDFAGWMSDFDDARDGDGPSPVRVLAALREAIDEQYSDARSRVTAAIEHISAD